MSDLVQRLRSGAGALRNYDDALRSRITIRAALLREVATDADKAADAIETAEVERDEARRLLGNVVPHSPDCATAILRLAAAERVVEAAQVLSGALTDVYIANLHHEMLIEEQWPLLEAQNELARALAAYDAHSTEAGE